LLSIDISTDDKIGKMESKDTSGSMSIELELRPHPEEASPGEDQHIR